jgi:hypothetical protein
LCGKEGTCELFELFRVLAIAIQCCMFCSEDILKFDNSHSLIRSKKIVYYVYVQEPEKTDS